MRRCLNCDQPLEELGQDPPIHAVHDNIYDCLRALIKRVEALEYELLGKKLIEGLSRSSEPGPPSSSNPPITISKFPK